MGRPLEELLDDIDRKAPHPRRVTDEGTQGDRMADLLRGAQAMRAEQPGDGAHNAGKSVAEKLRQHLYDA